MVEDGVFVILAPCRLCNAVDWLGGNDLPSWNGFATENPRRWDSYFLTDISEVE